MLKLCSLKTKFQKVLPFWLNKKQDFSRDVLGTFVYVCVGGCSYNLLFAWSLCLAFMFE